MDRQHSSGSTEGVVWLRGETPDRITEVEARTREVPEVAVENPVHLPKTPAPTRTNTLASQRKTRPFPRRVAQGKAGTP